MTPRHAYDRQKLAFDLLDKLAALAGGYTNRKVGNLVHDIRNDVAQLTRQAQKWQDYCRDTGHDPILPWNEDR